jgi:hypothetical protein
MITDPGMFMGEVLQAIVGTVSTYGPPLAETMGRYNLGQIALTRAAVPRADLQTLGERVARVLACDQEPLLGYERASLSPAEIVDYLERLHKDILRTPSGDQR